MNYLRLYQLQRIKEEIMVNLFMHLLQILFHFAFNNSLKLVSIRIHQSLLWYNLTSNQMLSGKAYHMNYLRLYQLPGIKQIMVNLFIRLL